MINKPPPFKGLSTRIPIIIPIKGRGFINKGSTLVGEPMSLENSRMALLKPMVCEVYTRFGSRKAHKAENAKD